MVYMHPNNRHNNDHDHHDTNNDPDNHKNNSYHNDHNKTAMKRRRFFVRQNLLIKQIIITLA